MKKIISLLLVIVMMLSCCSFALANNKKLETRATVQPDAGLTYISGNTYNLWGRVLGSGGETLSISVNVYKDGVFITNLYGSGAGPIVNKNKNVYLSSGTYILQIVGSSPTDTNSKTKYIVI